MNKIDVGSTYRILAAGCEPDGYVIRLHLTGQFHFVLALDEIVAILLKEHGAEWPRELHLALELLYAKVSSKRMPREKSVPDQPASLDRIR